VQVYCLCRTHIQGGVLIALSRLQSAVLAGVPSTITHRCNWSRLQVIPPGCSRYSISIKKPLGLVLEQNKQSGIITVVGAHLLVCQRATVVALQ
jgi:hypothetical protein